MVYHLTKLCQIVIQPPSLQTMARNLHWLLAQLGQPYYVSTGSLRDSEYCSRSLSWSTSVQTAWHRRTWQMTVNSSPMSVHVDSVRLTVTCAKNRDKMAYFTLLYTDHLRRPVFCRCWPTSLELFANRTKTVCQSRTV